VTKSESGTGFGFAFGFSAGIASVFGVGDAAFASGLGNGCAGGGFCTDAHPANPKVRARTRNQMECATLKSMDSISLETVITAIVIDGDVARGVQVW
jgi:hypothetical protein